MEPTGFGIWTGKPEQGEDSIPVLIRSRKDGHHILDMIQLEMTKLKKLSREVEDRFSFINNPFTLAGCNLGEIGTLVDNRSN